MRRHLRRYFLAATACGLLLPALGGGAGAREPATPEAAIADWPTMSRHTAVLMLQQYGRPARFGSESLVWENKKPWIKTVVFRRAPWPSLGKNEVLEQTIRYHGTRGALARLAEFDKRIVIDYDAGLMTMISEREKTNVLALNLADEVAAGIKTPKKARLAYKKALSLEKSGKTSPYMEGLRFPFAP